MSNNGTNAFLTIYVNDLTEDVWSESKHQLVDSGIIKYRGENSIGFIFIQNMNEIYIYMVSSFYLSCMPVKFCYFILKVLHYNKTYHDKSFCKK